MNESTSPFAPTDIYTPLLEEAYRQMIAVYLKMRSEGYEADGKNENQIRDDVVKEAQRLGLMNQPFIMYVTEHRDLEDSTRIDIRLVNALTLSEGGDFGITVECKIVGERHYVNRNGISSFAEGKYAADRPLAGMMGFVKEGAIPPKVNKIKKLLDEHTTIKTVTNLEPFTFDASFDPSYHSEHERANKDPIHLYHLFFDLVTKKVDK